MYTRTEEIENLSLPTQQNFKLVVNPQPIAHLLVI